MPFDNRKMPPGRYRFFPLIAIVLLLGLGAVVMLLWNAIFPELLHVNRIGYWQAVGLLALCRILFGNFGGRGPGKHGGYGPDHKMRTKLREKWMHMTPEERLRFRHDWQNHCRNRGYRPPSNETNDTHNQDQ